jgi:hypothetical protein
MPNVLVHDDLVVEVIDGGVRDGTPSFAGAAVAVTCFVTSISETERDREIDQTGPCDTYEVFRQVGLGHEFELELWIPASDGVPFFRALKNNYVRINMKHLSTGGVVTADCTIPERGFQSSLNNNQTERVRLRRYA